MKITITAGPVLDTAPVDPDARAKLAEKVTALVGREVSAEEIPLQQVDTYSLRYEQGQTYEVDPDVGGRFRAMGWAVAADEGAKVTKSKPFDTRKATDADAEEWDAKAEERLALAKNKATGAAPIDLEVQDAITRSRTQF